MEFAPVNRGDKITISTHGYGSNWVQVTFVKATEQGLWIKGEGVEKDTHFFIPFTDIHYVKFKEKWRMSDVR